jgi:hypothetical protein
LRINAESWRSRGSEVPALAGVVQGMKTSTTAWLQPDRATTALLVGLARWPSPRGALARRIAEQLELHELPDLDRAAVPWWRLAAALGDPDAQDYLQLLPLGEDPESAG